MEVMGGLLAVGSGFMVYCARSNFSEGLPRVAPVVKVVLGLFICVGFTLVLFCFVVSMEEEMPTSWSCTRALYLTTRASP